MGDGPDRTEILLLGPVQVRADGRQLALRSRKQRIALIRLALRDGRPVPIDVLVDDLWDDAPPKDPVHALQAHMSRLRAITDLEIELVNGGYRLADPSLSVDVAHFTELCERGRDHLRAGRCEEAAADLDAALALWRGPALGELGDEYGLRPFVLRLNELRRDAEAARAEALLQCGRGESLVAELRASIGADPLREAAWHQLMRALWQTGREAEALAAYGQAREAFIEHLGVEPGSNLSELHGTILNGMPPPATPKLSNEVPAASGTVGDATDLIGRRFEFSTLRDLWHRRHDRSAATSRPDLQIVTLSGEPGIGKTRLLDEFCRAVRLDGGTVLRGECHRTVSTPLEPFAQMLQTCLDQPLDAEVEDEFRKRGPELASVLPSIVDQVSAPGAEVPPSGLATDPWRIMDAVAAWLSAMSRRRPLLLAIDDVHWADEQTLRLLQHLITTPRHIDALVVVGLRDSQVSDADGSPAADLLRQSTSVAHLALDRFDDDEVTALIAAESEGSSDQGTLPSWGDEYVRASSGGNPLFVIELTRQLLMADSDQDERVPAPPTGVRRVVEGRIARLPEVAQTLLQIASVLGANLELERVAQIWDGPSDDLEPALAEAVRSRLIEPLDTDRPGYAFSHDVVRMVLYELLPPSQRSQLHTRVALAIETSETPQQAGHHQTLAHHYRRSDLPDAALLAATHLYHAGRDALTRGSPADAATRLGDALELLDHEGHDRLRAMLLVALGTAQIQLARPESRSTLFEAARIASDIDDTELLTAAVLANNRGWWSSAVDLDHVRVANIETALSRIGDDRASKAQLLMAWAQENVRHPGSRTAVIEASDRALELVENDDSDVLASVLADRYTVMFALFEDPLECVQVNERLLSLARRHGDQRFRLSAAIGMTQASMRLGEFSIADRYLSEAGQLAETLGDPPRLWLVRGWQAMRAATRGKYDLAEELSTAAFELGDRTDQADALTWFAGQLFTIRLMQRRLPEIVDSVQEQVEVVADGVPGWQGASAVALAQSGRVDAANDIIDAFAVDGFERLPRDMLWLNGMHYFSMACTSLGRSDVADDLYRLLLPYSGMMATTATICAGPVDLQLGALAGLIGQSDIADQHLRASVSLCRRSDLVAWADEATRLQPTPSSRPR